MTTDYLLGRISIHSLVKRETRYSQIFLQRAARNFNPLPRKEGDWTSKRRIPAERYFNPLPRKEGDVRGYQINEQDYEISIHSLVKRETASLHPRLTAAMNFNPLPRKEGDNTVGDREGVRKYFNPLPRKEGDCKDSHG